MICYKALYDDCVFNHRPFHQRPPLFVHGARSFHEYCWIEELREQQYYHDYFIYCKFQSWKQTLEIFWILRHYLPSDISKRIASKMATWYVYDETGLQPYGPYDLLFL